MDAAAEPERVVTINLVMAREPIPAGPSVFLAGPTHPDAAQSWRPAAVDALAARWAGERGQLTILSPESRGGQRARRYRDQVRWESSARNRATVVLFWIPRDLETLPGFTTNVEFGLDVGTEKAVVLGCPMDCPAPERNRYLIHIAHLHGVPVRLTLPSTAATAVHLVTTVDQWPKCGQKTQSQVSTA